MTNSEPGLTGAVIGGVSLVVLRGPLHTILVGLKISPDIASAIIDLFIIGAPIAAALWARARTVTTAVRDATAAVALALPSHATTEDLNVKLAAQLEPLPAVT